MSPFTARIILCALAVTAGAAHAAEPVPGNGPGRDKIEASSWTDDWSILPAVFYQPETDLGFGLVVIRSIEIPDRNPSVSTIALGLIYTTKAQYILQLMPDLRFDDVAFVHAVVKYERFPTRFFSDGAHVGDEGEPYDEETLIGHLDARVRVVGHVRAGIRWEYRYNDVSDYVAGGALERSGYRGLDSYFASGIGPVISFDSRDEPRLPTRGALIELRAIGFSGFTGSDVDALMVDLDVRGYLSLGGCHVLAGEISAQSSTGELPFQMLPHLGGSHFLRGWFEGHLRDQHALLAQLEWRFPLFGRVGGAAFFSLGEAVADLGDLSFDGVRAGGGVGARYLLSQKQNVTIRFDLAWGSGFGAYFDVLEAF